MIASGNQPLCKVPQPVILRTTANHDQVEILSLRKVADVMQGPDDLIDGLRGMQAADIDEGSLTR